MGRTKQFCKAMKHTRVGSGADSPFTRGCTLVPVLCFSTKEEKQRKHAMALSAAVLEQNAYLNTRQIRWIDIPEFCHLCVTDGRRTPLVSRILYDNETYEKAGVTFGNLIEQMGPIAGSTYYVKWLYAARTESNDFVVHSLPKLLAAIHNRSVEECAVHFHEPQSAPLSGTSARPAPPGPAGTIGNEILSAVKSLRKEMKTVRLPNPLLPCPLTTSMAGSLMALRPCRQRCPP